MDDRAGSVEDRRAFLRLVAAGSALGAAGVGLPGCSQASAFSSILTPAQRSAAAHAVRNAAAQLAFGRGLPIQVANGDETRIPAYAASYSKGLPHDARGFVIPTAFEALLSAVRREEKNAFESVPLAGPRRLVNPMAGAAFDLQGPDSHACAIPPAPRFDSAEQAAEAVELYWMALARDVPFVAYAADPVIAAACADLSALSDLRAPMEAGSVTPATLFRGSTVGDRAGPFLSQFLLRDAPYGALSISQKMRTVPPGIDYLTDFSSWLAAQNGAAVPAYPTDGLPRYIRSLRDLAEWVHIDALHEAYFNACLYLLSIGAPFDPGNPYVASATQDGFGTFGAPHILTLVTEVATRALKAVWYQKWNVHRRARPEEFGGRVHLHVTGQEVFPLHPELLSSAALAEVFSRHGSYLLPQAYPEGCPLHPAYGAGHATVAGACVTILKAWFDGRHVLPSPVVPSADGTALLPYGGPESLTVSGELDKLAANIALGRSAAGIHWRTDYLESLFLGETVALAILEEQRLTYEESPSFTLTRFDGTTVTV
ncbi:MAG: vanadium-dependent haloperoxidase [Planctomycetaceae bacterium]